MFEGREVGPHLLPSLHELAPFDDGNLRLAVAGDVGDLLGREGVVQRDGGGSRVNGGQVPDHVLRTIAGHDRHEVAPADPDAAQAQRRGRDGFAVLAPIHGLPSLPLLPGEGRFGRVFVGVRGQEVAEGAPLDGPVDVIPFGKHVLGHGYHLAHLPGRDQSKD